MVNYRFSWSKGHQVYLIAESVSTNNDGLHPTRDWFRDLGEDDRFAEHGPSEDIADLRGCWALMKLARTGWTYRSVWTPPHFFKFELFYSSLVGGNGGTFDTNLVFLDGLGSVNCHLIVCLAKVWVKQSNNCGRGRKYLVAVFESEIIVLDI